MWRTKRRGLSKCSTGPTSSLVVDTKSVSVDQWMSLRLLFGNTSPYPEKLAARVETSIHLYKVELPTGELRLNLPRAPIQHGCLLQRPYLRHFRRCLGRESSTSIPCILPVSYTSHQASHLALYLYGSVPLSSSLAPTLLLSVPVYFDWRSHNSCFYRTIRPTRAEPEHCP